MKRSEMLARIEAAYEKLVIKNGLMGLSVSATEISQTALSLMEELGMKPPFSTRIVTDEDIVNSGYASVESIARRWDKE